MLRLLRDGVIVNDEVHRMSQALIDLPGIQWEEFLGHADPPAVPPQMIRLTERMYNFWVTADGRIRWDDHEYRIFRQIVQSLASKRGFNITLDLSSGQGALAQIVQTPDWNKASGLLANIINAIGVFTYNDILVIISG